MLKYKVVGFVALVLAVLIFLPRFLCIVYCTYEILARIKKVIKYYFIFFLLY